MGTKNNPGTFDCYENAHPDEPMFVLLGRDPIAPLLVRIWAQLRAKTRGVDAKVVEAHSCAKQMDVWQLDEAKKLAYEEVQNAYDTVLMLEREATSITVEELERLRADSAKLARLEGAGVDNWEGYDEAMRASDDE